MWLSANDHRNVGRVPWSVTGGRSRSTAWASRAGFLGPSIGAPNLPTTGSTGGSAAWPAAAVPAPAQAAVDAATAPVSKSRRCGSVMACPPAVSVDLGLLRRRGGGSFGLAHRPFHPADQVFLKPLVLPRLLEVAEHRIERLALAVLMTPGNREVEVFPDDALLRHVHRRIVQADDDVGFLPA